MGIIKSQSDQRSLRQAGQITKTVLSTLAESLAPGTSTVFLEELANRILREHRSTAPFKGYQGFNHAICVSINDEIVNGPPSRERVLQDGDVISIATAAEHRGLHAKAARTFYMGSQPPPAEIQRLLQGTASVIPAVQARAMQVNTLNELLAAVPETAQIHELRLLQKLGGSGIGKKLHDHPYVPNSPDDLQETVPLQPGLCFTLMPMFSLGLSTDYLEHADGWTLLTTDGALSAHFADTLLLTDDGLINITGSD